MQEAVDAILGRTQKAQESKHVYQKIIIFNLVEVANFSREFSSSHLTLVVSFSNFFYGPIKIISIYFRCGRWQLPRFAEEAVAALEPHLRLLIGVVLFSYYIIYISYSYYS